eukprot:s2705_g4.t1
MLSRIGAVHVARALRVSAVQGLRLIQPQFAVPIARLRLLRHLATGRGDVAGDEMQVTETEFHAKAEVSLQRIFDSLDVSNLDCDGVLTVKLEGGSSFVINKHYGTRQIWYASPVSGALYFNLQADATWRTKDTTELGDCFLKDSCGASDPGALNSEDEEQTVELSNKTQDPLVGYAFKIQDHPLAGQVTYMRVYQGKVGKGDAIVNMMNNKRISVKRLVRMHSNEIKDVNEAGAGDIVALAGVDCESGVTFTDGKAKVTCSSMFVPEPVMSISVTASRDDQARFQKALKRFQREDPTFQVEVKQETSETIISGMGELHLEVYCERMRREFKVQILRPSTSTSFALAALPRDEAWSLIKLVWQLGAQGSLLRGSAGVEDSQVHIDSQAQENTLAVARLHETMFGAEGGKPSFWKELIATALDQKSLQNGPEVSEEDFLVSLKKDPGAAVVHEDLFEGFSLEGIGRKALFLRNTQAEMIAKNPDSLTKLVQNFVQQPPKLVINLCVSKGFREHLCSVAKFKQEDISPGTVEKCAPFPLGNGKKEIAIGSDWLHKIKALQNYYCKDQNARISVKSQDGTPSSMFGDKPLSAKFQPLKALDLLRLRIEGSAVVRKGAKLVLDLQLEGPFVKNLGHLKKIKDKFEAILPPNSITKTRLRGKTEKEDIQEKVRRLKRQGRLSAKEQEQCIEEPVPRREDFPLEVSCGDGEFEKQIKYTPDWYERLKTVAFELVKQKRDAAASTDVQEKTWISLPGQAQTTEAPTEEDVWKEIELKTQKWAIAGSSASKRRLTLSALQEPSSEYELVFELKQDQFIKGREPYVEFSVADRNLNWQEAVALAELLRAQGADLKPVAGSTEAWHLPSQEEFPLEVEVGGLSKTEEKACEDLLENFISTTLLPLAAKTQALILCTAVSPICVGDSVKR